MLRRILRNLSKNFCIYLLAALNLIHAVQEQSYDWLLWCSLALVALSLVLNIITAVKEAPDNGEA